MQNTQTKTQNFSQNSTLKVESSCKTEDKDNVMISSIDVLSSNVPSTSHDTSQNLEKGNIEELNIAELQDKDDTLKLIKEMILNGVKPLGKKYQKKVLK